MSKSGQPATKADTGGQRVPKAADKSSGNDKKGTTSPEPAKKSPEKKKA